MVRPGKNLGFPADNQAAVSYLSGHGFECIEKSYNNTAFLSRIGHLPANNSIVRIDKENFHLFETLHSRIDSDMYWNSERMYQALDRWVIFVKNIKTLSQIAASNVSGSIFALQVTPVDYGKSGFGFDVTTCPYSRLYAKYGAREIGPVLCRFDETMSAGIDGLTFIRHGTLCRGDKKCDFLYRKT